MTEKNQNQKAPQIPKTTLVGLMSDSKWSELTKDQQGLGVFYLLRHFGLPEFSANHYDVRWFDVIDEDLEKLGRQDVTMTLGMLTHKINYVIGTYEYFIDQRDYAPEPPCDTYTSPIVNYEAEE